MPNLELKSLELRSTKDRTSLLKVLKSARKPLTIAQIAKLLPVHAVNTATIYRNLNRLEQLGLIRRVDFKEDKAYFELASSDHHHLVCISCGLIEDFAGCNITSISSQALKKSKQFSLVKDHSLELFGICKKCDIKN